MDPPTYPFEETSFMNGPLDEKICHKLKLNFCYLFFNTNRILFDLNFKRIHSYFFGAVENFL